MEETLVMNPFAEDIVYDPRKVNWSLPGLNDMVIQHIEDALNRLGRYGIPGAQVSSADAPHTLQINSPHAGYGKSHLIGQLFELCSGRATQVYVRPFEDPLTCWKSLLVRLVQELQLPDRGNDGHETPANGPTQLDAFAISTIARIVVAAIESLHNPPEGAVKALPELHKPVTDLVHFGKSPYWRAFFKALVSAPQWLDAIQGQLLASDIILHADHTSWLNVLSSYALDPEDWEARQSVLEWLRGESIDQEIAHRIGIRPADLPEPGRPARLINQLCRERILDLCQLAGFYRPFMLCFDQTDHYGKDPALAIALGGIVADLNDHASNQITLLATNQQPWAKYIDSHWNDAQRERVTPLTLEGLTKTQGKRLASHRLQDWLVTAPQALAFLGDNAWFDRLFDDHPRMGTRLFLQHCRKRWQQLVNAPKTDTRPPLEHYFQRYQDKIHSDPRRLVFDRDTLHWVFTELAQGVPEIEVGQVDVGGGERLPQWRCDDQHLVFGFESGNHWKTWHTIARKTQHPINTSADTRWVFLRTPELPPLPGPWACAAEIRSAMAGPLRIFTLERNCMVKLWAAYDLYSDAMQRDIPYDVDEISQYLRNAMQDFWTRVVRSPEFAIPATLPQSAAADHNTKAQVQTIVQHARVLSVDELLTKLTLPLSRDVLLNMCHEIPEIHIHFSPEMTALQWRPLWAPPAHLDSHGNDTSPTEHANPPKLVADPSDG